MNQLLPRVEDRLADFNQDKRILVLAAMASVIGAISAVIAYVLVSLINLITNVAFFNDCLLPVTHQLTIIWDCSPH